MRADQTVEEIAHRVAWSAVKHKYGKFGDQWLPLSGYG
jgi:cation transport regulator ChaB